MHGTIKLYTVEPRLLHTPSTYSGVPNKRSTPNKRTPWKIGQKQ